VPPSPKQTTSVPTKRDTRVPFHIFDFLKSSAPIIGAVLTILSTWLLFSYQGKPNLHCDVYSPLHDPDGSGDLIQIVVIRNLGKQAANGLEIHLGVPRSDSMDYFVDSTRKPAAVNRDDSSLYVAVDTLPPGGFVCITIRLLGAPLSASAITISSREGTMGQNHIRILTWEDYQ
jgi:hypothetical protein